MLILWDDAKREQNRAKHGLDFADLSLDFFARSFVIPTKNHRFMAIGILREETVLAVVFAPRGTEAISVVSMRPASRKERSLL